MSTILLVEDEDMLRGLIRELLLHRGFSVVEASHAHEAIRLIEEDGLIPDVLLTDVSMPGMNGEELAGVLRAKNSALKVVFMSGFAGASTAAIQASLALGEAVFLQKPFRMQILVEKIRELLAKAK